MFLRISLPSSPFSALPMFLFPHLFSLSLIFYYLPFSLSFHFCFLSAFGVLCYICFFSPCSLSLSLPSSTSVIFLLSLFHLLVFYSFSLSLPTHVLLSTSIRVFLSLSLSPLSTSGRILLSLFHLPMFTLSIYLFLPVFHSVTSITMSLSLPTCVSLSTSIFISLSLSLILSLSSNFV